MTIKSRALYRWLCVDCRAAGAENADSARQVENIRHGHEKGNRGDVCGGRRKVIERGKTYYEEVRRWR